MMHFNSIRARLTFTITLAVAGLMAFLCEGLILYMRHNAEYGADRLLITTADQIRTDLTGGEQHYSLFEAIGENQNRLSKNNLTMVIIGPSKRILQQSQKTIPSPIDRNSVRWRISEFPFGPYKIILGLPWQRTESTLRSQAMSLLILGICVTIISSAGAWWLVGRTLTPISSLSQQAKTTSSSHLQLRLQAPSRDKEIIDLVGTLNSLLESISQTAAVKSQFYAAASHELRTPLHVLSGSLEVAMNKERSRDEYLETIAEAYAQTQRLTSLVRDMLCLSQLDFVQNLPPPELINLSELLTQILHQFEPAIEVKHQQVETKLPVSAPIVVRATHAEMLIRNLVENAVKYTADNGKIWISIKSTRTGAELEIINEFPPLPRLDGKLLFEPFYRPDISRAIHSGGNGLGLAICKTIADVNSWGLTFHQEKNGIHLLASLSPLADQMEPTTTR
jgi:signal transduction histidine kinase